MATMSLSTTQGCEPNPSNGGFITANAGAFYTDEYIDIQIWSNDTGIELHSAYTQGTASIVAHGLENGVYFVQAFGTRASGAKGSTSTQKKITLGCQPTPDITITPDLNTPGTIKLDMTSTEIDISNDVYRIVVQGVEQPISDEFTSWTRVVVNPRHITLVAVIDPRPNLVYLTFKVTLIDISGYSEYLYIYYRKVTYTKNCGANQVGTYTSIKTALSLVSVQDAYNKALALATADADANLVCDTDIKFEEVVLDDKSFTVSYSLENQSWACFHDYKPDAIFCTANLLMSFKETKIYIHNQYQRKGRFYNQDLSTSPFKMQIEFVSPNLLTKTYHSVSWKTQFKIEGIINEDFTFDAIMVYNHNQCSGEITIIPQKILIHGEMTVVPFKTTRNAEGVWRFNGFRDMTKFPNTIFLDTKGNVIPDAINTNKAFFKQTRFISDYICSRLIFNNKDVFSEIVLSDFTINDKVSYR